METISEQEIIDKARQAVEDMYPYTNRLYMSTEEQTWIEQKRTMIAFGFEMGAEWMQQQLKNI